MNKYQIVIYLISKKVLNGDILATNAMEALEKLVAQNSLKESTYPYDVEIKCEGFIWKTEIKVGEFEHA